MGIFKKQYQVKPNMVGFLYRNNELEQTLKPGIYSVWDWQNKTEMFTLPITSKLLTVTNQEVLSKDNIAFRFSFQILYKITDGLKFLNTFPIDKQMFIAINEAEYRISSIAQLHLRRLISEMESETLNENRNKLSDFKTPEIEQAVLEFGVTIESAQIRDLTFPKSIQDLFARHLEAKIRAKSDIENARTAIATARALKNASELMKDDENIRFFQILETITKIAEKGKNTFLIGDIHQLTKK